MGRGHGDGVGFGDAHIVEAFRKAPGEALRPGALAHGGGDDAKPLVPRAQLAKGFAHDAGIGEGLGRAVGGHAVVAFRPHLGRLKALSLRGEHMQKHGPLHLLGRPQRAHQRRQVVSVHGTQIGKAQILEKLPLHQQAAELALAPLDGRLDGPARAAAGNPGRSWCGAWPAGSRALRAGASDTWPGRPRFCRCSSRCR